MADHIQIYTPDESTSYKFAAIAGQWTRTRDKMTAEARTLGGGLDIAQGSVYQRDVMVVKVRETETEVGYGDKSDLETLYNYSRIGNNILRIVDHYGVTYYGIMSGRMGIRSITTTIEGDQAWYHIPIELIKLPEYYWQLKAIAPDNLIALLPLWDSSGSAADDLSSNEYDGTYDSGVTLDQPGIGDGRRSVYFDGAGSIDIQDAIDAMDFETGSYLVWLKPPAGGFIGAAQEYILNARIDANNFVTLRVWSAGTMAWTNRLGGTGSTSTKDISSATGWQLFGCSWASSRADFFYNGAQFTFQATGSLGAGSPAQYHLGAYDGGHANPYTGWMGYFALWDTNLSTAQHLSAFSEARR